jgi:hypothetical protein
MFKKSQKANKSGVLGIISDPADRPSQSADGLSHPADRPSEPEVAIIEQQDGPSGLADGIWQLTDGSGKPED